MITIEDIFESGGLLDDSLPDYSPRPQQQAMARAVEYAITERKTIITEAGTGTGKTFAYLAPSLISKRKVIISTGTKTLQDQLFFRDLPFISKAIGISPNVTLLKGRSNYLCRFRLDKALSQGRLTSREQVAQLHQIKDWSRQTIKGDVAEVSSISEGAPIWYQVTSTADNCLGSECPSTDNCFVNDARAHAHKADIVVCNHHLFFADFALQLKGVSDLLPNADAYIFDEAHQLPDIAHQFLGNSFSSGQINDLVQDTLAAIEEDAEDELPGYRELGKTLFATTTTLFNDLQKLPTRGNWSLFRHHGDVVKSITELQAQLGALCGKLEQSSARSGQIENCFERSEEICIRLNQMTEAELGFVHWYEVRKNTFAFHMTPLDVSHQIHERMTCEDKAWIFTSATLSVDNDCSYFMQRMGISESGNYRWDSPFDYQQCGIIFLPPGMPEPNTPYYTQHVIKQAMKVLEITDGKAFLLFTSLSALQQAAELMKDSPYPLFVQGNMSKRALLDEFKKSRNGVLLGSASFWEGVDVKGEALSLVIIDKLPFASPAEPVISARISHIRENGGEPFWEFQIPQSVINLKQGVGRLIRDEKDRGILMLCDPRLSSKSYGRIFLKSLPPMAVTQNIDEVSQFFLKEKEIC